MIFFTIKKMWQRNVLFIHKKMISHSEKMPLSLLFSVGVNRTFFCESHPLKNKPALNIVLHKYMDI